MLSQIKMEVKNKGPELVKCERCEENVEPDKIDTVHYSLKRGVRVSPEKWCKDCQDANADDFCGYCGSYSMGSTPCAGCRRMYN